MTFGWANTYFVQGRDRNGNNNNLDPRLAGVNLITNGSPATFYVDLPAPGTYSLSLAMGDAGYEECWSQCQIQFLDGNTMLATVTGGDTKLGYFYDAAGNNWSATDWPVKNVSQQVTLTGTRLTVIVGTSKATGDYTPIAFLGISGGTDTGFQFLPSLVVAPGQQGSMVLTFTPHSGFNSPIALSVGNGAGGRDDHVEPGHHTRPRVGLVNHDGNSGAGRNPGNVSDRRDRHWRRHEWSHHRSSDCEAVNQPQAEGRISLAAIKRKA